MHYRGLLLGLFLACWGGHVQAQQDFALQKEQAREAMKRAATYYHDRIAVHGGYVYYTSLDLKTRWGEGEATPSQIWVQPPGTPTVGLAFLSAYEATGDEYYLKAATEAAEGLMFGQMQSGGWEHAVDYDPKGKRSGQYRNGQGKGKNYSTFDDDSTQAALLFLMKCDQAHEFKHQAIHEATLYAMNGVFKAQFPIGAFPQVFDGPVKSQPVIKASYPKYDWRTENHVKEYWNFYTLNDDLAGDMTRTLVAAWEIYQDERALNALKKLGDFLILAQLPDPQPAWAQQYNFEMHPCWARKFEPPAITGHESQDAILSLMTIYRVIGDKKYLQPIPKALDYLDTCVLPDGQIARFYELQTNKPLYMTKEYQLTYDDGDLPTHYGFKQKQNLAKLRAEFEAVRDGTWKAPKPKSLKNTSKEVQKTIDALDQEGRWVSGVTGDRIVGQPKFKDVYQYLSSEVFSDNLTELATFVATKE